MNDKISWKLIWTILFWRDSNKHARLLVCTQSQINLLNFFLCRENGVIYSIPTGISIALHGSSTTKKIVCMCSVHIILDFNCSRSTSNNHCVTQNACFKFMLLNGVNSKQQQWKWCGAFPPIDTWKTRPKTAGFFEN